MSEADDTLPTIRNKNGLVISALPDWGYAGKTTEGVIPKERRIVDGRTIVKLPSHRVVENNRGYKPSEYVVETLTYGHDDDPEQLPRLKQGEMGPPQPLKTHEYLVPLYPKDETSFRRRGEKLLIARVRRFFYSCEPGMDVGRTGEQLEQENGFFEASLKTVNQHRNNQGLLPLDFKTPPEQMTRQERLLSAQAAKLVGHSVNRLGKLGCVILQKNREGVDYEHDDDYIKKHMDEIKDEFVQVYFRIAHSPNNIISAVQTRKRKIDPDGNLADLVREIGKPVMPLIENARLRADAKPEFEVSARKNIVSKIAQALESIDTVALSLQDIVQHSYFTEMVKASNDRQQQTIETRKRKKRLGETDANEGDDKDDVFYKVDAKDYRELLRQFVEACRARACIKAEDAENFDPVDTHIRFLQMELGLNNTSLLKGSHYKVGDRSFGDRSIHDEKAEKTAVLLKRGIAQMEEIAEMRMPRNHRALTDLPEMDSPDFAEKDTSSVGRLTREIQKHVDTALVKSQRGR